MYYGNGGYDYDTVYNMPIWLRKFTFNELKKIYSQKTESSPVDDLKNLEKNQQVKFPKFNKSKKNIKYK